MKMQYLPPLLCLAAITSTSIAHKSRRDNKPSTSDVEAFLEKLLKSDKFDKLAERIAEKAADKITSRIENKHVLDDITAENERTQKKIKALYQKVATANDSNSISEETALNVEENPKQYNFTLSKARKINPIVVVHKFSDEEASNLSLKFKHFSTTPQPTDTTVNVQTHKHKSKSAKHGRHKTAKRKPKDEDDYFSKESASKVNKKKKHSHGKKRTTKHITMSTLTTSAEHNANKSASYASDESFGFSYESDEDPNTNGTKTENTSKTSPDTNIPISKLARIGESRESDSNQPDSEYEEKTTASLHRGDLGKSGQVEDPSNENLVKESDSYEEKSTSTTAVTELMAKEKNIDELDLKHKIREQNGKLYAFAQDPDYEEYHQQVKEILKSVRENQTMVQRADINLDLLDLIE